MSERLSVDEDEVLTSITSSVFVTGVKGVPQHEYYKVFDVRGLVTFPTVRSEILDSICFLIHTWIMGSEKVVIHCDAGAERAPLVAAWYLHQYHNISMSNAWIRVSNIRLCAIKTISVVGPGGEVLWKGIRI